MADPMISKIFSAAPKNFDCLAMESFQFQVRENPVYQAYIKALGVDAALIRETTEIPFLPASFFVTQTVQCGSGTPAIVFESSGTTGTIPARHPVRDLVVYETGFLRTFELFYGPVTDYCILALLPSYIERQHSSLLYMAQQLIQLSGKKESDFFLYDFERLAAVLSMLEESGQKTILLGVTFALLDFAEQYPMKLRSTIIMETGGMKGRRTEMVRAAVHEQLKAAFSVSEIHSEYGMTELLSQAYSKGEGIFHCPPWMQVLVRSEENPLQLLSGGRGKINVIDLANVYSCSFIATEDAGKLNPDGSFEVLGRADGSDLRGCSLMVV